MLGNVLASWLTSLRERGEFEICFRSLLRAQGYVSVGIRTTHGPIEYGKDVAAWHPRKRSLYLFQLKAGDVARADWPQIATQLYELAAVPYNHPNYVLSAPRKPVLVCTGQVNDTVQEAIARQNQDPAVGRTVEIWDREILVAAFRDHLFSIHALSDAVAIDHIRMWSHISNYGKDEEDLWAFFNRYLSLVRDARGRELRRVLAGYVVAVAQLSQRYRSENDTYSAIDCTILGAVVLYEAVLRHRIRRSTARFHCDALRALLAECLQGLYEECVSDPAALCDLTDNHGGPEEIFMLPVRAHSLASKLALHAFLRECGGDAVRDEVSLVDTVVRHHPSFAHVVSERQAGTLVVTLLALLRYGFRDTAIDALVEAVKWVAGMYGQRGAPGLPDPYQPLANTPFHFLGLPLGTAREVASAHGDASYLLPVLVKFACLLGRRGVLERTWPRVSRTAAEEYVPEDEIEMYSRSSARGEFRTTVYPERQSWRRLRQRCCRPLSSRYLSLARAYPEAPLLLSLAYPWRASLCEPSLYLRGHTFGVP